MTASFPTGSGRAFSLAQARERGMSMRQWRRPELVRVTPGVRAAGAPATVRDKAVAFALALPLPYAYSHLTACLLHGLPIPNAYCSCWTLHVMRPTTTGRLLRAGCQGHRGLEIREVVTRHGVPVVGIADTWVDLGEVAGPGFSRDDLIIAGDAAVLGLEKIVVTADEGTPQFEEQLAQLAAKQWEQEHGYGPGPQLPDGRALLAAALASRCRPRGAVRLTAALALVRSRVRSPMETRSRLAIIDAGIPEPETGYPVTISTGWVGEFDLAWPEQKVLAEYQGAPHGSLKSRESDRTKRELVEAEDWKVIEVYSRDVFEPGTRAALMRRIRAALDR